MLCAGRARYARSHGRADPGSAALRLRERPVPDGERPLRSDHPLDRSEAPRRPAARALPSAQEPAQAGPPGAVRDPGRQRLCPGDRGLRRSPPGAPAHLAERRADRAVPAPCTGAATRTASRAGPDGQLVGGLYGVSLGAAFFGESMFSRARDASKVALVALVERLRAGGYRLLDTQFVTDHLRQFGAIEIAARAVSPRAAAGARRRRPCSIPTRAAWSPARPGRLRPARPAPRSRSPRCRRPGAPGRKPPGWRRTSSRRTDRPARHPTSDAGGSSRISRNAALSGGSVGGVSRQARATTSSVPNWVG